MFENDIVLCPTKAGFEPLCSGSIVTLRSNNSVQRKLPERGRSGEQRQTERGTLREGTPWDTHERHLL